MTDETPLTAADLKPRMDALKALRANLPLGAQDDLDTVVAVIDESIRRARPEVLAVMAQMLDALAGPRELPARLAQCVALIEATLGPTGHG